MTQDDGGVSLSGNGSLMATYTYPFYFLKHAVGVSNKEHVSCEGVEFNDEKGCFSKL